MSGPVGEDKGPYPTMSRADVDDSAEQRSFVVAVPDLFICEEILADSFQDAAAHVRIAGLLDEKLSEVMQGADSDTLFRGFSMLIIEAGTYTVARVRLGLMIGWDEGGDTEAVIPHPPPGR